MPARDACSAIRDSGVWCTCPTPKRCEMHGHTVAAPDTSFVAVVEDGHVVMRTRAERDAAEAWNGR